VGSLEQRFELRKQREVGLGAGDGRLLGALLARDQLRDAGEGVALEQQREVGDERYPKDR